MMKNRVLLLSLCCFNLMVIPAQEVRITVKDSRTGEGIAFANLCTETLTDKLKKYQVTDINGQAVISISQRAVISVSCLGYKPITDTISPERPEKNYVLEVFNQEINEVVVTGQYKPVSADRSIYNIRLIGKDKIDSKAATNLAEILSDEPGIRLTNDPSTGTGLILQGVSGENIKILIDGVPVIGRLEGKIDLNQLNLDNVNHIEIIEGPMSVVYGSNALGGVINIITDREKPGKFRAGLNSYYESAGTYNFSFLTAAKHKEQFIEFSGGRNFFGGFTHDTTRTKEWKPKEQYDAGLSCHFTRNAVKIRFNSDFFRERLLDRNEPFAPYYEKANDTWFRTVRFNNSLELSGALSESSAFSLLSAYSYYDRTKLKYLVDLTDLSSRLTDAASDHDTSVFDAFMLRGVYTYAPGNSQLSAQAGFDANLETAGGKRIESDRGKIGDYAVFAGIRWDLFDNFTLQPGLRIAYNTKYDAPLTPSINLRYNSGKTILRASWARGFRSPSLKELYLYFYDSNHQIEGNEGLQAERSHNFSFSANHSTMHKKTMLFVGLKAYYNLIEDKISLVQADPDNALHYRNENTGSFKSKGLELSGTIYYGTRIKLNTGFSYTGIKDEIYGSTGFNYNSNFNAGMSLNFIKNTAKLAVFYKFSGKYPVYFYDASDHITAGQVNGYHTLDASIGKKFRNNRIILSTGVKNLFNNIEAGGIGVSPSGAHGSSGGVSSLAGWGRTYFVSMKINGVKY